MSDCPTCGFPMAWSEDNEVEWCSVYGTHPARRVSPLLLRADAENHAQPCGKTFHHGRAA